MIKVEMRKTSCWSIDRPQTQCRRVGLDGNDVNVGISHNMHC